MCGHRHSQYRINPQLYWFTDMDIDRKPTGFHCRKSLEGYFPRLYELWHCPQCHYTAHNRVFPDPLKHVYIEKGKVARHMEEVRKAHPAMERVIQVLGGDLTFEKTDFPQAIRMALLDIHFQRLIVEILNQDHEDVARAYLRLAWLYRDWHEMQAERVDDEKRLAQALDQVVPDWPDCPCSERDALEGACTWFQIGLDRAKGGDSVETCSTMAQVARIRVKMGDLKEAGRQLDDCHRTIMNELDVLTRAMNEDTRTGHLKEEERGRLLSDSRKLRALMDECRTLKEGLLQKKALEDRKRAKALAGANPKASGAALRKLLEEAGIPENLITELVPERKEGLFGGLFRS